LKAELVFVGTELLLGEILNTNAQYLSQQLALLGIDLYHQQVVGDNAERLAAVFRQALGRCDVVIASGGLGPTMDDLTREVAAEVTGRPLETDQAILADLQAWFAGRGRTMAPNNARQAMVPRGATALLNDRGTAPGLLIPADDGKVVILLPGPPIELRPMFEQQVAPYLARQLGATPHVLVSRTLRFIDIGESALEDGLKDLIAAQGDPSIAPYAKTGEVHLRLATKANDQAAGLARIAPVEAEIRRRFGQHIYGVDGTSLEEAVGHLLLERGLSLAAAESCTGGLISKRITDVAGSSAYFGMGLVTYSNEAKMRLLGVPAATLEAYGAVSEETVRAMAEGALRTSGAGIAVAVSGIAGPGGGTPEKPVGTVCFGLAARGTEPAAPSGAASGATPSGTASGPAPSATASGTWSRTLHLWGSRTDVRDRTATHALAMIRRYLLGQKV
jgi:nicotinamide-nucleotide amidase